MFWKIEKEMLVGIPQIDIQHKILYKMLSHIDSAIKKKLPMKDIYPLIDDFGQYIQTHFSLEKSYYQLCDCDEDRGDVTNAEEFLIDLKAITSQLEKGNSTLLSNFMETTSNWVFSHILNDCIVLKEIVDKGNGKLKAS